MQKEFTVYELFNQLGTVEYVGVSTNPVHRFYQHTKIKPKAGYPGMGKFYKRQDLILHQVAKFEDKKQALILEGELKMSYGMKWGEKETGKICGSNFGKHNIVHLNKYNKSRIRKVKAINTETGEESIFNSSYEAQSTIGFPAKCSVTRGRWKNWKFEYTT